MGTSRPSNLSSSARSPSLYASPSAMTAIPSGRPSSRRFKIAPSSTSAICCTVQSPGELGGIRLQDRAGLERVFVQQIGAGRAQDRAADVIDARNRARVEPQRVYRRLEPVGGQPFEAVVKADHVKAAIQRLN